MGIVFYSTIRGIPQFYYGTEIIMSPDEKRPGNHGLVRTEFPGGGPIITKMLSLVKTYPLMSVKHKCSSKNF